MKDSLEVKLEHIQRDFLIDELKQHSWNIDTVSKRYSIPKQELLNTIGEKAPAKESHNQYRTATTIR